MTPADDADVPTTAIRRLIARQPDDLPLLERICLAVVEAVPALGAGVNLMATDGVRGVCATSDPLSERVEELQFLLGEGPCIDAFADRRPVLATDLDGAGVSRWPFYAPAALAEGVRAVFAFPLQIGAVRLGVLDVFGDRPGPLTGAQLRTAIGFAEVTVETLLDLQQHGAVGGDHTSYLDVGSRAVLFQAQGMVMVQLRVSIGEALARLRAYAYAENRRLEDVARDVVDQGLRLDGDKE